MYPIQGAYQNVDNSQKHVQVKFSIMASVNLANESKVCSNGNITYIFLHIRIARHMNFSLSNDAYQRHFV